MKRHYRNIDPSGIQRLYSELEASDYGAAATANFRTQVPRELAKLRRQAMLRPAPVNGNRVLGRRMGYFETTLRDQTLAYFMRRTDDCLQASIASVLGIPMAQVPDAKIDQQLQAGDNPDKIERDMDRQLMRWSDEQGLTIMIHSKPPWSARRWIGVAMAGGELNNHCLIMSGRECIWDVTQLLPLTKYESPVASPMYAVQDIDYGITIEKR